MTPTALKKPASKSSTKVFSNTIIVSKMRRSCADVAALLKNLSHPERLMILGHLSSGEKKVTELSQVCEISQSQTSQFLIRMRAEGLLKTRREGQNQYYAIVDIKLIKLLSTLQELYCA